MSESARFCRYKKSLFKDLNCVYCCFCGTSTYRNCSNKKHLATIEHILPIAHGGSRLDKANMAISCCLCNEERGLADFLEFKKFKQGFRITPPIFSVRNLIKKNKTLKQKSFILNENHRKYEKDRYNRLLNRRLQDNFCINHCFIMSE